MAAVHQGLVGWCSVMLDDGRPNISWWMMVGRLCDGCLIVTDCYIIMLKNGLSGRWRRSKKDTGFWKMPQASCGSIMLKIIHTFDRFLLTSAAEHNHRYSCIAAKQYITIKGDTFSCPAKKDTVLFMDAACTYDEAKNEYRWRFRYANNTIETFFSKVIG